MRFDLEFNKVSSLRDIDLTYVANTLYELEDNTIIPAKYDNKTLFNRSLLNKGNINTRKFNNFSNVPSNMFPSYVLRDGLNIYDKAKYNSLTYILLNGGSFISGNKDYVWSNLYVKDKITSQYILPENISTKSISIYTLTLKNPSYIDKKREYRYVEFSESLSKTFKKVKEDNIYTITDGTVHLNNSITYTNEFIGKGDGATRMFALPEFPVLNITIDGFMESDYVISNGIILFNTAPLYGEDISATFDVTPVISYKRDQRRDDVVYLPYNINPSTANLKNGMVCAYNSYKNLNIPDSISLTKKCISDYNNTYKITCSIKNSTGIPLSNKKVTFKIEDDGALFSATNSIEYVASTSMNGQASATVFGDYSNRGIYIQKEQVSGNTISIPKDIDIENTSDFFLYIITANDPLLGKINAQEYETQISEYYTSDEIASYFISGRKSAYLKYDYSNSIFVSTYIKPILIEKTENLSIPYRNLNILNENGTIRRTRADEIVYNGPATRLTYDSFIPSSDDIVGYYIVFNKKINIIASYEDEYVSLQSNSVEVEIKNIRSESPFTISGTPAPHLNTKLDDLSYLSLVDYINNGYNFSGILYGCIHSDTIDKRCIHANKAYHLYYNIDSNNTFCIHTPEYDATLPADQRCPGVEARMINTTFI